MPIRKFCRALPLLGALAVSVSAAPALHAQAVLTTADYDRAARMLSFNVNPLVTGGIAAATWLPDDRFYYKNSTTAGSEWVLVDPAKGTR
ncbi:MAG: S9 family peptidase, partial [Gemmatimonadaceae bacterium]